MKHHPTKREAAAWAINQCEARRRERPSGTCAHLGKHVMCVCTALLEVMLSSSSEADL